MEDELMEPTEVDTSEASEEVLEEPVEGAYTIKVDGEQHQVSLEELQDGYQRQADYTRKTQELADERRRLQQAEAIVSSLESNPEETLMALGDAFGIAQPTRQPAPMQESYDSWDEESVPMEDATAKRLSELEQRIAQQDRHARRQQVEKQVNGLKDQYGEFDSTELFQHALRHKIGNLEAALTHMRFGEVSDKATKLEKEQERTGAKRDAAVVESGGSTAANAVKTQTKNPPQTIREAFAQAKKNLT